MDDNVPEGTTDTEIGSVPDEWRVAKLGEIVTSQYGYTASAEDTNVGPKFLRITDIDSDGRVNWSQVPYCSISSEDYSKFALNENDILVARIGATTGKACIAKDAPDSVFASYLIRLTIMDVEAVSPDFIHDFTKSPLYWRQIDASKEGKLKKGVSATLLKELRLPLPPLPEQKNIAAVLSAVQEAKEKTGGVIEAARELKKSLMKHVFTYGPVSPEDADKISLKDTEIGLVPEGWEVVKLEEVIRGTQYGISMRGSQEGQYPILRMNNLVDGKVTSTDLQYVDLGGDDFRKFQVNKGDILFNRTNSFELVGKTALFDLDSEYVFASYLVRVIPDADVLLPEYLNYYLNWTTTQSRLKMLASRGVSQSNINATKLRGFMVPFPILPIQRQIADILSAVDSKIEAEENRKQALEELLRTLLNNLMTGRIRVNNLDIEPTGR